jgi:hypothetical protein
MGMHFLGLRACVVVFLIMLSSWNFLILNSQLYSFAQLKIPFVQFMMSCSFSWVSEKSLPVTIATVLSMNSSTFSPALRLGIFSMSALYSS